MKQFTRKQAIGQAGEYLVGAIVADQLGWPYRTQPIADLGVDGEVEVLDDKGASLCGIIKVQAKATAKEDEGSTVPPFARYVPHAHYEYWAALSLPVIVCRPVLATRKVYWQPASAGRSTGTLIKFVFTEADELGAGSAAALRELGRREGEVFDLLSGAIEEAHRRVLAVVTGRPKEEYAVFDKDFYPLFDAARKLVIAVSGMRDLFPGLVTERATALLTKLMEVDAELERVKNYVDRNREL